MREKVMHTPLIKTAPAAPSWREWNTADVRQNDRFAYYREGICESYLACTPEMPDDGEFSARLRCIELESGTLAMVDMTPHLVERTKRDLALMSGDLLTLCIQLGCGRELTIAGKTRHIKRGDVYLYDPINPLRSRQSILAKDEHCTMLSIRIDRSILAGASKAAFDGFATLSGRPFSEALGSCLTLLAKRATVASHAELNNLCAAARSLLAANLAQSDERPLLHLEATPTSRLAMLTAIKLFVGQQIANPTLSPVSVANKFGISARYLHKIFEGDGETFGTLVLKLRLEHICEDLSVPSNAHVPISEIAQRWGFKDLTSFHRNFKLRFHETPGNLRSARGFR